MPSEHQIVLRLRDFDKTLSWIKSDVSIIELRKMIKGILGIQAIPA